MLTASSNSARAGSVRLAGLLAAVLLHTQVASAAVGPVLLTDAAAQAGNITPGDTPGYPITISRSGSYKLDGSLSVPAGKNGIVITTGDVTIDFAGFSLGGGLHGIYGAVDNVTIENGIIVVGAGKGIFGTGNYWVVDNMAIYASGAPSGGSVEIFATGRSWIIRNSVVRGLPSGGIAITGASGKNALIENNFVLLDGLVTATSAHLQSNTLLDTQIDSGTVLGNLIGGDFTAGPNVGFGNNAFVGNHTRSGGVDLNPNVCNGAPCP